MSVADRERSILIRYAWISKIDLHDMSATIEYLDTPPGHSKSGVDLPTISAGRGWGMFSGLEEGNIVAVGHTKMSRPVILSVIPMRPFTDDNLYNNYLDASIMSDNKYLIPKPGETVIQGKANNAFIVNKDDEVIMRASNEDQVKISGKWRALTEASEQVYKHSAAYDIRAGTIKRDINRIRTKDEDLMANFYYGDESEQVYEPIGKCLFEDGSDNKKLALARHVDFVGSAAEIHNQKPLKYNKNEALSECRIVYREFSPLYLDDEEQKLKATKNDNFFNLMKHRNNILEMADNDLAEVVYGPLVDINGVLLDINYMPLDTNINSCPKSRKETVLVDGVSISGREDIDLTMEFPTRINNATIFNFQLNTLGTDYKREMHWSLGDSGKKEFEGLVKGSISKNWAYDTALDSDIWGNVNSSDLVDSDKITGAFVPPRFQLSVDKTGAFKLHIPASSLEHPVIEWTKWDLDPTAEVTVEKGDNKNWHRTREKNKNLFDRIKRYGGELYHPMQHTSLPTIGGEFRVIEDSMASSGGFYLKNFAMVSPVGYECEIGKSTNQAETDVFDNVSGKSQNPAYCPIGQSGKIGLDGRLDISLGRDHADWKSLVADLRGGAVLRLGRMYDEQSCECHAEEPWGKAKVAKRSGKANDDKVFNDRRSLVFETDGIVTGTLGRSIEREHSLDLNTKAALRLHVGKANYGIKLDRKLIQFSRDYNPQTEYDPDSKKNMGYRYYESSRSSQSWDEFNEERHDKILANPRVIDGTYTGSSPQSFPDPKGKITPDSTNAIATRSIQGGSPREHHVGYILKNKVEESTVNARTMHWLMEEIAHVTNNSNRYQGLGPPSSSIRNSDERIILKADARDTEAGSINLNLEADALVTIRDDLDYTNLKGNRTSLRLDTSGQIAAWIGADIDDYRSLSFELDGGVQSVWGKTKSEGKSFYGTLKGGIKMLVGVDNQDVEHNTDEGLKGYPSAGEHYYNSSKKGTGKARGGRKYEEVGYHPHINKATTDEAGAVRYESTDDMWAADLNGEIHHDAIQHVDIEGTSANIKTQGSVWFTLGMNRDKESVVLDTAGSMVAQVGVDQWDRSMILHTDGSMSVYLGKEQGGDSLHVQMAGGANISIKKDDSGNAIMLGVSGNVVINIDNADKVITNIASNTVEESIVATEKVSKVITCPKTEISYTGDVDIKARSIHLQTETKGTIMDM